MKRPLSARLAPALGYLIVAVTVSMAAAGATAIIVGVLRLFGGGL